MLTTLSAPEDHSANGRAEVAVREIKRAARRCLIAAGLDSSLWPLAVRQASEQAWRRVLRSLELLAGRCLRLVLRFMPRTVSGNAVMIWLGGLEQLRVVWLGQLLTRCLHTLSSLKTGLCMCPLRYTRCPVPTHPSPSTDMCARPLLVPSGCCCSRSGGKSYYSNFENFSDVIGHQSQVCTARGPEAQGCSQVCAARGQEAQGCSQVCAARSPRPKVAVRFAPSEVQSPRLQSGLHCQMFRGLRLQSYAPPEVQRRQSLSTWFASPKTYGSCGVVPPRTKWRVMGVLYGLVSSPRSWSVFRDGNMRGFRWEAQQQGRRLQQCMSDPNVWLIKDVKSDATVGIITCYVDDLMVAGSRHERDSFLSFPFLSFPFLSFPFLSENGLGHQ